MPEGTKSEHKEKAKKEKAAKKEKDDGTKDLSNYYEKTEGERQKIIKDSNKAIQQQKIADLEYEKNLVLENTNLTELEKLQKTLAIEKQINTEKLLMNLQANSEQKAIDDKKLQDAADAEKAKQEKLVKGKTISKEEAAKREKQIDDDLKKSLAENDIKFDNLETQITENSLKDKSKIELENAKKTADEKKKLKELDVKWEERLELDKLDNIENEQEKKRAKELYDLKKKYDDDVKLYGDDAKKKEIIDKQYAANVKKINDKDNPFNKENLNKMSQTFGNTFGDMFAMSKNFFGSLKKAGLGAIFDLAQKQLLALQIPIVGMFSSFIPPPFGEIAGWTLFGTLEGILGGLKSQVGANTGYSPGDSLGSPDSTDTTPVMFDAKNENIMNAKTKQYTPLFKHLNKTGDLGSFPGLSNMFVNQNGKLIDNVSPNFNFQNTQTSMESKLSNIEKQVTNGKDRNINVKTSAKVENFGVKVKRDEIEYLMRDYPERSFG